MEAERWPLLLPLPLLPPPSLLLMRRQQQQQRQHNPVCSVCRPAPSGVVR
jgi:hypothetical protein